MEYSIDAQITQPCNIQWWNVPQTCFKRNCGIFHCGMFHSCAMEPGSWCRVLASESSRVQQDSFVSSLPITTPAQASALYARNCKLNLRVSTITSENLGLISKTRKEIKIKFLPRITLYEGVLQIVVGSTEFSK